MSGLYWLLRMPEIVEKTPPGTELIFLWGRQTITKSKERSHMLASAKEKNETGKWDQEFQEVGGFFFK